MMKTQHTQGEWHVDLNGPFTLGGAMVEVVALDGMVTRQICTCMLDTDSHPKGKEWLEDAANARLIAAAPDLLSALERMLLLYNDLAKSNPGFMGKVALQDYENWNLALLEAPRALAKVRGDKPNAHLPRK